MWDPALKIFTKAWPHFIHVILLTIVHRITESKVVTEDSKSRGYYNSLLVCWFGHIFDNYALHPQYPIGSKFKIPFTHILYMCANKIDKWTIRIIKKLQPHITDDNGLSKIRTALHFYNRAQDIRRAERKLPTKRRRDESSSQSLSDLQNEDFITFDKPTEELDLDNFETEFQRRKRQKLVGISNSTTAIQQTGVGIGWEVCTLDCPGLGLLHNGQVPNLDLPKELDSLYFEDVFKPTENKLYHVMDHVEEHKIENNDKEFQSEIKEVMNQETKKEIIQQIKLLFTF